MVTTPTINQPGWGPVLNAALEDLQEQINTSKPWLNVLDFGAAADGQTPDPTDNTGPFQDAIDAAGQGGIVYIPPGQYRLGSPVVLTLGVTLRGAGWSPHFAPRTNMTTSYLRPGLGKPPSTAPTSTRPTAAAHASKDWPSTGAPHSTPPASP